MGTTTAEQVTATPAPPLRPYVASYTGYRVAGATPGVHRGLPSPYLTLIITLAATVDVTDPGATVERSYEQMIGGLHGRAALVRHDGNQHGVQLALTPVGARALFGLPAGELAGVTVDLEQVLGPKAVFLTEQLRVEPTWQRRFAVLDTVLTARLQADPGPGAEVGWAWQRLLDTRGAITIGALATEVGWSARHLGERFVREYGLRPKEAAKIIRFDVARRLLLRPAPPSIAQVAASTGYFDQAHLTRDWNDIVGLAPTRWLAAEDLAFVQDESADAVAS